MRSRICLTGVLVTCQQYSTLCFPDERGVTFPCFYGNKHFLAVVVCIYINLISFSVEKRKINQPDNQRPEEKRPPLFFVN